ncbi:MAG: hypothetical protein LUB61_01165 [Eggerthellaceae bacterium]|nr:hypothetical protein [Eggerthellaceae bacterium]
MAASMFCTVSSAILQACASGAMNLTGDELFWYSYPNWLLATTGIVVFAAAAACFIASAVKRKSLEKRLLIAIRIILALAIIAFAVIFSTLCTQVLMNAFFYWTYAYAGNGDAFSTVYYILTGTDIFIFPAVLFLSFLVRYRRAPFPEIPS